MTFKASVFAAIAVLSSSMLMGCESLLYDMAQTNNEDKCRKYLGLAEYDACLSRIESSSFKDYNQRRDELLK